MALRPAPDALTPTPRGVRQGQQELQIDLPRRVIGDAPLRPHVGTQEALGTVQSAERTVIRNVFLEGVAFKLRTR